MELISPPSHRSPFHSMMRTCHRLLKLHISKCMNGQLRVAMQNYSKKGELTQLKLTLIYMRILYYLSALLWLYLGIHIKMRMLLYVGTNYNQQDPFGLPHIRLIRLLFSAGTVFFSHNNSAGTVFSANFSQSSDQRTGPIACTWCFIY